MIPSKTATRLALGAAVAVAALLGTTGCSFIAPQATLIHYDPAEGVGTDLGQLAIRNAEAVANPETGAINLVFSAINTGSSAVTLNVSVGAAGVDGSQTYNVPAGKTLVIGQDTLGLLVEKPTDAVIGGLYSVTFQAGTADSVVISVPVLTDEGRAFLTPFVPTGPVATPSATPTS